MKMVESVVSSLPVSKLDVLSTKAIQKWLNDNNQDNQRPTNKVQEESLQFMRGIMDECTHLKNFSVPADPELIIVIAARYDAYYPREGTVPIDHLWPGCEIRYVECGHITGYVLYQKLFRQTISEAINRHRAKYYADGTLRIPERQPIQVSQSMADEATPLETVVNTDEAELQARSTSAMSASQTSIQQPPGGPPS